MEYFRDAIVRADQAIVDRYNGGFVNCFGGQSLSISIPYSRMCSAKFKTDGVPRLAFVFTDVESSVLPWTRPLPTMNLWRIFDFARYVGLSSKEKQHSILDALHSACIRVAEELEWPKAPFIDAFHQLKSIDCEFSGISKRKWISLDRTHRAQVAYSFTLDGINLSAILFRCRTNEELERVPLGTFPHSLSWGPDYLARGQWVNDSEFEVELGSYFVDRKRVQFASLQ